MTLSKLYPIVDRETLDARGIRVTCFAGELARAGVTMLQYRDKRSEPQAVLRCAAAISAVFAEFPEREYTLVLNDRPDLALLAGWRGVHVGQSDLTTNAVRQVMDVESRSVVGLSTHDEEQVRAAEAGCADYVAVGPIFATSSKADAEPVVGLEGLRRARALTTKPIVAIGGITRENARSVMDAGADSVAVIGGLFVAGERPGKVAADFLELLG